MRKLVAALVGLLLVLAIAGAAAKQAKADRCLGQPNGGSIQCGGPPPPPPPPPPPGPPPPPPPPTVAQCQDGIDNDGDAYIDYPSDTGCLSTADNDESGPGGDCNDGIDNDADGKIDWQNDPDCGGSPNQFEHSHGSTNPPPPPPPPPPSGTRTLEVDGDIDYCNNPDPNVSCSVSAPPAVLHPTTMPDGTADQCIVTARKPVYNNGLYFQWFIEARFRLRCNGPILSITLYTQIRRSNLPVGQVGGFSEVANRTHYEYGANLGWFPDEQWETTYICQQHGTPTASRYFQSSVQAMVQWFDGTFATVAVPKSTNTPADCY